MIWKKKGLLITPGKYEWMVSFAQSPFIERTGEDLYKVHFVGRDRFNRARGGFAIIEFAPHGPKVLSISEDPSLDLGNLGCFDDSGVMPSCIVDFEGDKYMYYTGWKQEVITPFSFFVGLAISQDGGKTYERYSLSPVLGRNRYDPFLTGSPWIIREKGIWRMWYVSGTGWKVRANDEKPLHMYNIRYAESQDGLTWIPDGKVCIDFEGDEYAIARPVVYKEKEKYKMFYSVRGGWRTYRAGYAESTDGLSWKRLDTEVGIDVSETGWDSQMICYPFLFKHDQQTYMLYNGNDYGKTGFGYAVLDG